MSLLGLVDVSHPDFDCCAYLLCYSILTEVCWNFAQGIFSVVLTQFQPSDAYWDTIFLAFSAYLAWRKTDAIEKNFDSLRGMLSGMFGDIPQLPFSLMIPKFLMYIVSVCSYLTGSIIGRSVTSFHGIDIWIAKFGQFVVNDWRTAYPTTYWLAAFATFVICYGLTTLTYMNLDLVLLNETPANWISYRITNFLASRIRKELAQRKEKASSKFLQPLNSEYVEFEYHPLPAFEFRLLKLDANHGTIGLSSYSLPLFHQDDNIPYEAVSYQWGVTGKTHSITVQNELGIHGQIKITTNARNAIAALYPQRGVRYLWIDSICIDQANPDEMDAQILLMQTIFSNAVQVVAYLGVSQSSSLANNFLSRAMWHATSVGVPMPDENGIRKPYSVAVPFQNDFSGWCAFRELTGNEFWTRAWVLQEVVVAKRLVIHYDHSTFPWTFLYNFESWFKNYKMSAIYRKTKVVAPNDFLYTREDLLGAHSQMFSTRCNWIGKGDGQTGHVNLGLVDLLVDMRKLKATQPQDQVYAIIGISKAKHNPSLRPNHRKSVEEVYKSVALYALESGSFLLFSISGIRYPRSELQLPSWVPDLTRPPWYATEFAYTRGYTAGISSSAQQNISHRGEELELRGYIIDEIKACADEAKPDKNKTRSGTEPELDCYPFNLKAEDVQERNDKFYQLSSPHSPFGRLYGKLVEIMSLLEGAHSYQIDKTPRSRESLIGIIGLTWIENSDGKSYPATEDLFESFLDFMTFLGLLIGVEDALSAVQTVDEKRQRKREMENGKDNLKWAPYFRRVEEATNHRKFAVTQKGYAAMVPSGTMPGDIICVFVGSPMPHILRAPRNGSYELFGDAYVHGLMDGEATRKIPESIVLR